MSFLSRVFGSSPLKLAQNLGAYPLPNGDISPLYVFLNVENASGDEVEILSVRVSPKGAEVALAEGEIKGKVPTRLPAGENIRFEVRAKTLGGAARDAGYPGTPRLTFLVVDGEGDEHRRDFRLRVDEYLNLRDE
ncbi:MAG: hypothetical protein ACR2KW_02795 [Rubrobacter sp.]